jgi:hypothetical protein
VRAVARLVLVYFTGTAIQRWLTALGLTLGAIGAGNVLGFGPRSMTFRTINLLPLFLGILGLVFAGSLMPVIVGCLARGHQLYVLPHSRWKVLVSALGTVALLSLFCTALIVASLALYPVDHATVFVNSLVVHLLTISLVYVAIWFVSRARSALGVLGGVMLVIGCLVLPNQFIQMPTTSVRWIAVGGGLLYVACGAVFLLMPRLRDALGARGTARRVGVIATHEYVVGQEVALMLGTARPWVLAVGQAFPITVATLFITMPSMWLFYFALCSAISGAMASAAAARSRCLWLRARWSRHELFRHVEASFLRHNTYSVSALIVLLVAIGTYRDLPTSLLALGMALLIVGTAASTYLGLMMTRGVGWVDCICAIGTMGVMMAAAVYARGNSTERAIVMGLEVLLAVLTLAFRALAIRRWRLLDWMICRSERSARTPA